MNASPDMATVVIPAHNEGSLLPRLLQSVKDYGPSGAEIIVVDNGSSAAEKAIAPGALLISVPESLSPGVARNLGAKRARPQSSILVFLDADVELTPEWRAEWGRQLASLGKSKLRLTGATVNISRDAGWLEKIWFAPLSKRPASYVNSGNLIVTRKLFEELGGFDERLETGEDYDLCSRARSRGASLELNPGFKVYHAGYPKTMRQFARRERWHGAGDFLNLSTLIRSQVALATVAFSVLHVLLAAFLGGTFILGDSLMPPVLCGSLIALLCGGSVVKKLGRERLPAKLKALPVMYLYYAARSLSLWDAIRGGKTAKRHPRARTA